MKFTCNRGWIDYPGYNGIDGNQSETTNDSEVKEMVIGVGNCKFTSVYGAVTEILPIEPALPKSFAKLSASIASEKTADPDPHQLCSAAPPKSPP